MNLFELSLKELIAFYDRFNVIHSGEPHSADSIVAEFFPGYQLAWPYVHSGKRTYVFSVRNLWYVGQVALWMVKAMTALTTHEAGYYMQKAKYQYDHFAPELKAVFFGA